MAYEIICDTCGRSLDESYFFKDENGNHNHTCVECLRNENRELKAKLEEIRSKVLKFADEYRHLKSQTASLKGLIMHTAMKTSL